METRQPGDWRLTIPKSNMMTVVRSPVTNFKITVEADCDVSVCSPLPLSIKVLAHWCQWWVEGGGTPSDRCPPSPHQLPASKIKQTFLSTSLASSLAFWAVSSWTPLLVIFYLSPIVDVSSSCMPPRPQNPNVLSPKIIGKLTLKSLIHTEL